MFSVQNQLFLTKGVWLIVYSLLMLFYLILSKITSVSRQNCWCNNPPYRSTAWQYFPKKCSGGPRVPSDPPPCCRFTQSSADEGFLLGLLLMVPAAGRAREGLVDRSCLSALVRSSSASSARCGCGSRTSSSRRGKQHRGSPHRQEGQRGGVLEDWPGLELPLLDKAVFLFYFILFLFFGLTAGW